jgi:hypothetical protein
LFKNEIREEQKNSYWGAGMLLNISKIIGKRPDNIETVQLPRKDS